MKEIKPIRYAVVFPGQGAQYVGMGQEFAELFPSATEIFKSAEQVTGLPIRQLSFSGLEDDLGETSITQPCLLAASIVSYVVFQKHFTVQPEFVCGHSAGEYAALVAGGVLSFSDAMRLIQERGALMSKMQGGSMVALMGIALEETKELCREAVKAGGVLVPANLNSPNQIVVSGDDDSIESVILIASERNIKAVPLSVSGAFHSPLMQEAATEFANVLRNVQFNKATVPIISNVTAEPVFNYLEWMKLLEQKITSSVLWEPSIRYLQQQGIEVFVEIGPGRILSKLIQEVTSSAITLNVEDVNSLQLAITEMEKSLKLELLDSKVKN